MNSDTTSSTLDLTGTSAAGGTGKTGTGSSSGSSAKGGSSAGGMGMDSGTVQKMADKAHAAVDTLAGTLGTSTDKVMDWQQEYGEMAREQVRANPLAVVAGAFAVGYIFAKLTR